MPDQEPDVVVQAQLRLFCELMLGSPEAADSALRQIHRRALDQDRPPDGLHLFRIAADICGVGPA